MSDGFGFESPDGTAVDVTEERDGDTGGTSSSDEDSALAVGDIVAMARTKFGVIGYVRTVVAETRTVTVIPIRKMEGNKWVRAGVSKTANEVYFTKVPATLDGIEVRL